MTWCDLEDSCEIVTEKWSGTLTLEVSKIKTRQKFEKLFGESLWLVTAHSRKQKKWNAKHYPEFPQVKRVRSALYSAMGGKGLIPYILKILLFAAHDKQSVFTAQKCVTSGLRIL